MNPNSRLILLCSFIFSCFAQGQVVVRQALSDGDGNPALMLDGVPETRWNSDGPGQAASFLTAETVTLDAHYVIGQGSGSAPSYRLLASQNYRDWLLMAEGPAFQDGQAGFVRDLPAWPARYLRFESLSAEPVAWELFAGQREAVESRLAAYQPVDWGDVTDPGTIAQLLDLAFSWQMGNLSSRQGGIGWVNGAFYTGVSALYVHTGEARYRQAILDIGDRVNWTLPLRTSSKTFYHADDHCIGQSWLDLYLKEPEPDERWIADVRRRLDRVMANPLPGREDMNWCDALYMSPPNYGRLAAITGDQAYLTFIDSQWWDVTDFLYDPEFRLFYRDASYFPDREPNGQPVFWSRGNGWVIGGLVRMLEYLPADWPTRGQYLRLLEEMAGALAALQGEADGLWSSSLLYPEKYDMERETSGSAFFVYGIAWGINEGLLDKAVYGPVVEKGWTGLTTMLARDGTLRFIQQIGAGPARNNGELLDKDYGYGAFLLAGIEMMRYYAGAPGVRSSRSWSPVETHVEPGAGLDPAAWIRVEDFEGAFDWAVRSDVPYPAELVADPWDASGSRVFSLYTGLRTAGSYRATKGIPAIADGSIATVYQRFSYDNPEIDLVLGVSDEPVVDAYPDYENGFRIYFQNNRPEAWSSGYKVVGEDFLQLDTWYELWMVIDNAADTVDVYLQGGSNYPRQTLLRAGMPFRNGTGGSLVSYAVSYNSRYCEGTFFLDDLYVDTAGRNLSRPAAVRQPAYSPWSHVGREVATRVKNTPAGRLWDESFPWIYHYELNGWGYVYPGEYRGGHWIWWASPEAWLWLSEAYPGWAFNAGSETWFPFG